jgi:hypothetical protein
MCLKGELGNTGEPKSFLVKRKVDGVPPERKTPGIERTRTSQTSREESRDTKRTGETRYQVRTAKSERT